MRLMELMKPQFKFTPLSTAILSLLCSSTMLHAASITSAPATTSSTEQNTLPTSQPTASTAEATDEYPGQSFFEQYYVNKDSAEAQLRGTQNLSSAFCQGTWLTPEQPASTQDLKDPTQVASVITADHAYYDPNGTSRIRGNVTIEQPGRSIRADEITLDQTQTYAQARGRVQMSQAGILSQSDEVNYNLATQTGDLIDTYYISEQQHAHGRAGEIKQLSANVVQLNQSTFSTCPPGASPSWSIKADEIKLDQDSGRGTTKNAILYVKDTPVIPIPYFNFPIDDRRTTGFLTPSFGYTNDGGVQFETPYYFNLAPNYDLMLNPRYLGDRGAMIEGDFRYITERFGGGNIQGGYLPNDQEYQLRDDRKALHLEHDWIMNPYLSSRLEYNYVSDKDYFADLGNTVSNQETELNQRRLAQILYKNQIPGLTAQLKVESFQTIDPDILDVNKPYNRLPQFLLNYVAGNPLGLAFDFNQDIAYFKKAIEDGSGLETSGTRLYHDVAMRYNFQRPWAYVTPEVSLRTINTYFDRDSKEGLGLNPSESLNYSSIVPQFTLDAGLHFEKNGRYLQTLSPRIFYAYAPYDNQNDYPVFDTISASLSYDQLFNPNRFYGHDRLEDNNFAALGLSYRLYDDEGLERIYTAVGQSFYFKDPRVHLDSLAREDRDSTNGPIISFGSQLSNTFHVSGNAAWAKNGDNSLNDIQFYYTGSQGNLYNIGYTYRQALPQYQQQAFESATASFVQPIRDQWRLMGHVQYDLNNNVTRDFLLGINYESCCWGVSVYGRSYYNDLDDPKDQNVNVKRAIMAEFTLKGLGGLGGKLANLLEHRVLGFDRINKSWTER